MPGRMEVIVFMIVSQLSIAFTAVHMVTRSQGWLFCFAHPQPSGLYSIYNFPEGKKLVSLFQNICVH